MVGMAKILVGLLFGASAVAIIRVYPMSVLGVLLFFAGLELTTAARDQKDAVAFMTMAITAVGITAVNPLAGFLMGIIAWPILRAGRRSAPSK